MLPVPTWLRPALSSQCADRRTGASFRRSASLLFGLLAVVLAVTHRWLQAAALAFLSPPGVGAPAAVVPSWAAREHRALRFTADLHASPLLSSRSLLAGGERRCGWLDCERGVVRAAFSATAPHSTPVLGEQDLACLTATSRCSSSAARAA